MIKIINTWPFRKRGFGIVVVLGFAAILAVFTAAIGAQASFNMRAVANKGQADQAYYGAYTGIQMTVALLKEPPEGVDFDNDGVVGDSWLENDRKVRLEMPNGVEAAARLYHNLDGFLGGVTDTATDYDGDGLPDNVPPDGTEVPEEHFYIMAVGETKSGIRAEAVTMGSVITPDFPVLRHAVFGNEKITINGRIDHFDSDVLGGPTGGGGALPATYPAAGAPHDTSMQDNPLASVGTNSDQASNVVIGNTAQINGYVLINESADATTIASISAAPLNLPISGLPAPHSFVSDALARAPGAGSGHPIVNGIVTTQLTNKRMTSLEAPIGANVLSSSNYSVSGSGLDLIEGRTYTVGGNFTSNGGRIRIVENGTPDGEIEPVRLMIGGDITIRNADQINQFGKPSKLKFYSSGSSAKLELDDSTVFALFAGEDLQVNVKNGSQLWGAVLGNSVELDETSQIHFDRNLLDGNKVAANFGFTAQSSASTSGATVSVSTLAPVGNEPGAGGATAGGTTAGGTTAGGTTAGGTTAGGTTAGGTTTGGGGGGGGGGSMMMQMK